MDMAARRRTGDGAWTSKSSGGSGTVPLEIREEDPRTPVIDLVPNCVQWEECDHDPHPGDAMYTHRKSKRLALTPEGYRVVARLSAKCYSKQAIATAFGVSEKTLRDMLKESPEAQEAFQAGRAALENRLSSNLLRQSDSGNVIATIFALKAICGWKDDGGGAEIKPNLVVIMPGAMTPEQYQRLREEGVSPMQLPALSTSQYIDEDVYKEDLSPKPINTTGEPSR